MAVSTPRQRFTSACNWALKRIGGAKLHDMHQLYQNLSSAGYFYRLSHTAQQELISAMVREQELESMLNTHKERVKELTILLSSDLKLLQEIKRARNK